MPLDGPGPQIRSPRIVDTVPATGPEGDFVYALDTHVAYINENGTYNTVDTGTGDIGGSTGSTDNAVLRADGTGGKTLQNSGVIIDDNNNLTGSNIASGLASTATAAGTTTLTLASKGIQVFTGATTQTVVLPVVSTLPQIGFGYLIINDSSGALTINSSGANLVATIAANSRALITCTLLTGTSAASWDATTIQPYDSDLAVIAALTATTDNFIQAKSSAWSSRTVAQVNVDLQGDGLIAASSGFRQIPQNSQSAAYQLVAADSGKHIYHPSTDANSRQFTIPANGTVAFPIGTAVTFINDSANSITVIITTDVLAYANVGTITTLTIPQYNEATIVKVTSTRWVASGTSGCTTA